MTDNDQDSLLASLYDSVTDSLGFQAFTTVMCRVFDLKAAMLLTANMVTRESKGLWATGIDFQWIERYALSYSDEDMLANHIYGSPIAHFYASNVHLDSAAYIDTRFFREWVVPQGVACAAGAIVLREGPWISQIMIQRTPAQPPFSGQELASMGRLIPHLQRAMQMRQRFSDLCLSENLLTAGLETLAVPAMLINEFGCIAYSNQEAKNLLMVGNGLWEVDGHIQTRNKEASRSLHVALISAIRRSRGDDDDASGIVIVERPQQRPIMVMVSPLHSSHGAEVRGAALMFAYSSEQTGHVTPDLLKQLFSFSQAEAHLALALCSGLTLEMAAQQRGTSASTVRTQLNSLFRKTGTNRQASLIGVLLSSPAFFLVARR